MSIRHSWMSKSQAVGIVVSSLLLAPVPAQNPQIEATQAGEAGSFSYSGGAVKGKRVRTNTNGFSFGETSNWVTLPGASIQWTVPAGQTDLFNVAFSAETRMDSGDTEDYIRIRILDNGVPMEPYDGFQAFFSSRGYGTHKGNWARPAQAGNHTLTVQFWIQDGPPSHTLFAFVDDWTFELVVYD